MSAWTFTAQAVPRGQPRVRATAFGGRARVWTPSTADGFKSAVALAARDAVEPERWPIRHGWTLTAVFYLPRPQRLMGRKGGAKEMIPHTARRTSTTSSRRRWTHWWTPASSTTTRRCT